MLDFIETNSHFEYMNNFLDYVIQRALKKAKQTGKNGEIPVCAVIFNSETKEIISIGVNKTEKNFDPTAHAEMIAIQKACKKLKMTRLPMCDMYVTLEPCPMCATAISFARIRRLYFGAYDSKAGGVDHGPQMYQHTLYKPEVYGGIGERPASELLTSFFENLRNK